MPDLYPVSKTSLVDNLAQRVQTLIESGEYEAGQRLPAITEMARRFGVGHPTLREALKKLETVGLVSVRHGSGVYVRTTDMPLFLTNPGLSVTPSKKLLVDLIVARIPIETTTIVLAARNATLEDIVRLRALLEKAKEQMEDPAHLSSINMAFHREIACASGNTVLTQLVDQMTLLFRWEQRVILDIHGPRNRDHSEHIGLLEAIELHDETLANDRMTAHLEGVRETLEKWDPVEQPISRPSGGAV